MKYITHTKSCNKSMVLFSRIWLMLILNIVFNFFLLSPIYASPTPSSYSNIDRVADPNTMDSYVQAMMGGYDDSVPEIENPINNYGSRFAGEVWADKSVFAYGQESKNFNKETNTLSLDLQTDGINTNISLDEDFLHAFSVLGSSRQVIGETPIDLVMVLDVSGSMGDYKNIKSKIFQSINAMNRAIETLMNLNKENRVAVVLFASHPAILMPLAHYEPTNENTFIRITKSTIYDSSNGYAQYTITAPKIGNGLTTISTNQGNGTENNLSDIGSNTNLDSGLWTGLNILANESDTTTIVNETKVSRIPSFIIVGDGDPQYFMKQEGNKWWIADKDSLNGGNFNSPLVILSTIMRAAYMKAAVINNYQEKARNAGIKNSNDIDLGFYSIGIELGQAQNGQTGVYVASAILDPGNTASITNGGFNESNISNAGLKRTSSAASNPGEGAYKSWLDWKISNSSITSNSFGATSAITFDQLSENTFKVSKKQVEDNINYVDQFYNTYDANEINGILESLITQIATPAFVPVEGINASGVDSSITYTDPIGAYMELKDITDMTLFGKRYKIEKTAVYDYNINAIILGEDASDSTKMIEKGWYRNSDNKKLDDDIEKWTENEDFKSVNDPWDYATYRISYAEAQKHIPTLANIRTEITEKEKNTVFTFYHITSSNEETINEDENWKIITNPCYNTGAMNNTTTFNVDDIHMWLEDTGDYYDEYGSDNIPNSGFQQALYINIPVEAIPLQVATITAQSDGNIKEFKTNLSDYTQSTPLRIFYTVGFADEYINEDGDINLSQISQNYLNSHILTDENNNNIRKVYFNSNYFSSETYDGYSTDERSYSQGNPSVTFSPGSDNSFYLFQQTRLLYLIPGMRGTQVRPEDLDLGTLDLNTEDLLNKLKNLSSKNITPVQYIDQMNSDYWYYIIREYYCLKKDSTNSEGEIRYIALARKGSEFGSGLGSNGINKAEFLCWYDQDTNKEFPYNMEEENRGKPEGKNIYIAARIGGLRVGGMADTTGIKGQKIRENTSLVDNSTNANVTNTAENYYLPTISSSSNGDNIIVNTFLGNNGRLAIDNNRLLVTKTFNNVNNLLTEEQKNTKFNFTVTLDKYIGDHGAVVVLRDEFDPSLWRRRFDTIDVLTSNEDLLQNSDNSLAMVDAFGNHVGSVKTDDGNKYYYYNSEEKLDLNSPYEGEVYYVYVGKNSDEEVSTGDSNIFRVFEADPNDLFGNKILRGGRTFYVDPTQHPLHETGDKPYFKAIDDNHSLGERDYWIDTVYLIPIETVDNGNWTWTGSQENLNHPINEFVVASLNVTKDITSATELTSHYSIRSNYMTQPLKFTNDENGKYSVNFELDDGEGLLFYGINSNTPYSITETLTESQLDDGIYIQEVNHIQDNKSELVYPPNRNGFYTVTGNTSSFENGAHYVNYIPSIGKVEFTPGQDESVKIGDHIQYGIQWENFAFDSVNTNKNKDAKVTVEDPLDPGVNFINASFDPDFGNIINRDYNPQDFLDKIDLNNQPTFEDNNKSNNVILKSGEIPEDVNGNYSIEQTYTDDSGIITTIPITVNYRITYGPNRATGTYEYNDIDGNFKNFSVTIQYINHTVSWTIQNAPATTYGSLGLEVEVNEKANNSWNYDDNNFEKEFDFKVYNRAGITIENYPVILTNIIDNPTGIPTKTETQIERNSQLEETETPTPVDQEVTETPTPVNQEVDENNLEDNTNMDLPPETPLELVDSDEEIPVETLEEELSSQANSDFEDESSFSTTENNNDNETIKDFRSLLLSNQNSLAKQLDIPDEIMKIAEDNNSIINVNDNNLKDDNDDGIPTGPIVSIGDKVTYKIDWHNYRSESALVTITDKLDPGVDFVKASFNGTELINNTIESNSITDVVDLDLPGEILEDKDPSSKSTITISYASDSHTVTWTIENCPAYYEGYVELVVEVNEDAKKKWFPGDLELGSDNDYMIYNQASVQINTDDAIDTNIIENPLGEPGTANIRVSKIVTGNAGDQDREFKFQVELIDSNLSGSYGDMYFNNGLAKFTLKHNETKVATNLPKNIQYKIEELDADSNGYTTKAYGDEDTTEKEKDKAALFVNNRDEELVFKLDPTPSKEETTPGNKQEVVIGENITYKIHYQNTSEEATDIIIVDPLDVGVTYVSSSPLIDNQVYYTNQLPQGINTSLLDYNYDKYVQWTIKNVPANSKGFVELTVNVNDQASISNIVKDKAFVKNGDGKFIPTEEPENPVNKNRPHKVEIDPGNNIGVKVGQEITYQISYQNTSASTATITIIDPLDSGLTYKESNIPGTYIANNTLPNGTTVDYTYNGYVIWTISDVAPGTSGTVSLTAIVNTNATKTNIVKNKAFVQVNNGPFQPTEEVENPLGGPHKTELSPGNNIGVEVGEEITYQISYQNTSASTATITIIDPLDSGLTYKEASDPGKYIASSTLPNEVKVDYTYNGCVIWTISNVAPNATGTVSLTATVNINAIKTNIVKNKAFVKVNNDPFQPTEEVENPLGGPHKTELSPGNNIGVEVGEEITYQISYQNTSVNAATITIIDPLDFGLTYKEASDPGKYIASNTLPNGVTADYNCNGYVIWTIPNVAPNATGTVSLTAIVNTDATKTNIVKNKAFVQVNNGPVQPTEEVENPLGGPHKTETSPGNLLNVEINDTITYKISYTNNTNEVQDITIKDPLDIGLDYVSASNNGTYDSTEMLSVGSNTLDYSYHGVVTWVIYNVSPGSSGEVTLETKVNEQALTAGIVYNKAFVKVGNGYWNPTEEPQNPLGKPHKEELTPGYQEIVAEDQEITYQISYENTTQNTVNITIIDPIDSGLTFVSASDNGTYDPYGTLPDTYLVNYRYNGTVSWTIENVLPRQSGVVLLTLRVNDSAILGENSTVYNQALVQIGNNNFQYTEEIENPLDVESFPEIQLEKEHSTSDVEKTKDFFETDQGTVITYYLTVRNTGDTIATGVIVRDEIPEGLTYIEDSASNGGVYSDLDNDIEWFFESLDPGDSILLTFDAYIPETDIESYYSNIAQLDWEENTQNPVDSNEVKVKTPEEATEEADPLPEIPIKPSDLEPGDTNVNIQNPTNTNTNGTPPEQPNNTITNTTTTNTINKTTTNTTSVSPKTGISTNLGMWIGILLIAVIIICVMVGYSYYKNIKNK